MKSSLDQAPSQCNAAGVSLSHGHESDAAALGDFEALQLHAALVATHLPSPSPWRCLARRESPPDAQGGSHDHASPQQTALSDLRQISHY